MVCLSSEVLGTFRGCRSKLRDFSKFKAVSLLYSVPSREDTCRKLNATLKRKSLAVSREKVHSFVKVKKGKYFTVHTKKAYGGD